MKISFPRRCWTLGLTFLTSLSLLTSAAGQSLVEQAEVGSITSGVPLMGTLDSGSLLLGDGSYLETWSFTVATPVSFSMDLSSTSAVSPFDPFGSVSLPNDTIIASNDECTPGDLTRSCLSGVVLAAGTYYVGVNSDPASTGDYTLIMTTTAIPEPVTSAFLALASLLLFRRRRS